MKRIIIAVSVSLAVALSLMNVVLADDKATKKTSQAPQLAALLPASDGIVTFNVQRLLNEALPQILSADPGKLNKLLSKIEDIRAKTGIDLKQFEQVAVGIRNRQVSAAKIDFEPVILARGSYDASRLADAVKLASKGEHREVKIANRTVYVFSPKDMKDRDQTKSSGSFPGNIIEKMLVNLDGELAITSIDANTLALGTLPRVRETLEAGSRVSDQLLELVYRNQTAVFSFGANMPSGASAVLDLGNDEINKNIDVIRQVHGTMDVNGSSTSLQVVARASKKDQAKDLELFLKGMAEVGKLLIGGSKGADKKVYVRMIESARITSVGNDVTFELQVPQTDVDVLLGGKK